MDADETHALGYERVDDDPNVSVLLETMEATGRWEATLRLRAWEREQLNLTLVSGSSTSFRISWAARVSIPAPWDPISRTRLSGGALCGRVRGKCVRVDSLGYKFGCSHCRDINTYNKAIVSF
jgi:hypothetical protein